MAKVVGIDPGIHGALAIVEIDTGAMPKLIDVLDVPTIGNGAKERVHVLHWLEFHVPDHALIERAGSMPKQGVASTFKYARAVGGLEAVVTCCGIAMTLIEPAVWKKFHHLIGQGKQASVQRVVQLF